jgi:hypothetical protein
MARRCRLGGAVAAGQDDDAIGRAEHRIVGSMGREIVNTGIRQIVFAALPLLGVDRRRDHGWTSRRQQF